MRLWTPAVNPRRQPGPRVFGGWLNTEIWGIAQMLRTGLYVGLPARWESGMEVSRLLRIPCTSFFAYYFNLAEEAHGFSGPATSDVLFCLARIEFDVIASMSFRTAVQDGLLHRNLADEQHYECGILFPLRCMLESVVRDVGLLNIGRVYTFVLMLLRLRYRSRGWSMRQRVHNYR